MRTMAVVSGTSPIGRNTSAMRPSYLRLPEMFHTSSRNEGGGGALNGLLEVVNGQKMCFFKLNNKIYNMDMS